MLTLVMTAILAISFPNTELPDRPMLPGDIAGDSVFTLTAPQQIIPGYCRSILTTDEGTLITVPNADGTLSAMLYPSDAESSLALSGLGPCDSLDLSFAFPSLESRSASNPLLSLIVDRGLTSSPFGFFQFLDFASTDSCAIDGVILTDPDLPDSGEISHAPGLLTPVTNPANTAEHAVSVWDTYTGETYLYTSNDGGATFTPEPDAWSIAIPRPDTALGGPTLLAATESGSLVACLLAESYDGDHIGLQPWVTESDDWGTTWTFPELLLATAEGSALNEEPGSMPYGSFSGGMNWYAADLVVSGEVPFLFWAARRSFHDTTTAEDQLWPSARALLCSYPIDNQWTTVFIGQAMTDSGQTYEGADWPTATIDGQDRVMVFWTDHTADSNSNDIWAAGYDPSQGTWTIPVALTNTSGNEAMLEVAPRTSGPTARLLLADEELLVGESTALRLAEIDISVIWAAGPRPDLPEFPTGATPLPHTPTLTVRIAPQPARGTFMIIPDPGLTIRRVQIFDMAGRSRLNYDDQAVAERLLFPHSGLQAGSYLLRWIADETSGTVPFLIIP